MYAQSFFVTSVRGSAFPPTTSERVADGVSGFMNAAFGLRFFAATFFLAGLLARFFAGMHLSFRERPPIPNSSAPVARCTTSRGRGQHLHRSNRVRREKNGAEDGI